MYAQSGDGSAQSGDGSVIALFRTNCKGILIKTVDSKTNETVTNTYDMYGNSIKITTVTEKNGSSTIGVTDNTYDVMGNLLTIVSGENISSYIYDKAGRTLLANEKGDCTRTIYDSFGRTVQEIGPEDYDSTKDGLPESNTYADANAGQTYVYAANGTLTKETNRLGKTTKYFYNDIGCKVREEFDIYKFYYLNHGELYQVKVANTTTVSYSYSTDGKHLLLSESYANDDMIRYTYNDNGNMIAQYHNSNARPYVTYTYNADNELTEKVNTDTGLKYVYGENNSVSVYKTSDNTLVQSYTKTETEADEENNIAAKTDITENHFGINYSSLVKDKFVSYTAGNNTVEYSYLTSGANENERISSDTVKFNNTAVLSSSYIYDDKGNVLTKSYGENNSIVNTYDDKDRITSSSYAGKTYNYTYDADSQLIGVNGDNYTASYVYDSRGNIASETVNDEITSFTYANFGWKDLLIAVNGVELTYDEIGNVLTYGDKEFTWNTGRNLECIADASSEYSYTYDENGIRISKNVNGVTTYYNTKDGVILSQTDGTNTMYFQYDTNGIPLGFVLNGAQYFYLTNQMGDVVAITDTVGTIVGNYEYDAWGKVLTADTSIAQQNPIRYRGYYYDNETGYYYLQSRYYDPSICRFINADIPEIAEITKDIPDGLNLFAYCNNDAVNYSDAFGNRRYSIRSYSRSWVTMFLLKNTSYVYDYESTVWSFTKIRGVVITMKTFAKYSVGRGSLFSISKRGELSSSFGGLSVSVMRGSTTFSSTFTYRGSSIGAFIGLSSRYVNMGYYAFSTVYSKSSKLNIGLKLTISIHIAYIYAFTVATYLLRTLCPALVPLTTIIKTLYRTPAGIYSQAIILSAALYRFAV